jgi:hypothetical protein
MWLPGQFARDAARQSHRRRMQALAESRSNEEVLAQIIDYAKDLQAIDYADLEDRVRKARKEPAYDLFAAVSAGADDDTASDEATFIDAVSRNLRRGRFLLIIVGDGITENLENITAFLQQHAGLHFGLALVQLAVHELPGTSQRIVVPSIPLQTNTVVRGIVEWVDPGLRITPPPQTVQQAAPTSLTEEEFFAALNQLRPGTADRIVAFLKDCEDLQITWEVKRTLIVRMIVDEYKVRPFVVNPDGSVDTSFTSGIKHLLKSFAERLALAIPGTVARETPKTWSVVRQGGGFFDIWTLLDHQAGCRTALEGLNSTLREAAGEQ